MDKFDVVGKLDYVNEIWRDTKREGYEADIAAYAMLVDPLSGGSTKLPHMVTL